MDFIEDYTTTKYNILLSELKSEKKNKVQSVLGTTAPASQMVTTALSTDQAKSTVMTTTPEYTAPDFSGVKFGKSPGLAAPEPKTAADFATTAAAAAADAAAVAKSIATSPELTTAVDLDAPGLPIATQAARAAAATAEAAKKAAQTAPPVLTKKLIKPKFGKVY